MVRKKTTKKKRPTKKRRIKRKKTLREYILGRWIKIMGEKHNFFIDTNILVDYILLNDILKEKDKKEFPLYDKLKPSLDLINFLLKNKKKVRWCTSFINLCEMPTVLIRHIVMDMMYIQRIPFDYFEKYYSEFIKQKNFQEQVNKIINKYYSFLKNKNNEVWFIHNCSIYKEKDFKEIDKLRLLFKLPLDDGLIFFLAKKEKGFFVTNDSHHFNDKLKKAYSKEIKIVSPKRALERVKELIKKYWILSYNKTEHERNNLFSSVKVLVFFVLLVINQSIL